jgi:hypothetical protein
MSYPVPAEYRVNQGFRSYATAGVVGRPDGTEIQYLVWLYGNYQPYGHAGADIACPIGTPVYAIADGVVVWADWGYNLPGDESWGPSGYFKRWGMYKNFPGICTVIWHPHLNKFSIYGHLSSNDIAPVGTEVKGGQQIALSGNTKARGETVGPHLHIAVVADFTNYSTGGSLIFGCEDPVPYFTSSPLAYAGETTQEDDMSAAEVKEIKDDIATVHRTIIEDVGGQLGELATKVDGIPKFDAQVREQFDLLRDFNRDVRADLAAKGAALQLLAELLAGKHEGLDAAGILAQIDTSVKEALSDITITLSTKES